MLNFPAQLAAAAQRPASDGNLLAALLINILPEPAHIHGWYWDFYQENRRDAALYHYAKSERHLKQAGKSDPFGRIKSRMLLVRKYEEMQRARDPGFEPRN